MILRAEVFLIIPVVLLMFSCSKDVQDKDTKVIREEPASWPMYRGDSGLTGYAEAAFPDDLVPEWTFQAGDSFISGPVSDGNYVYVADIAGIIYCLNLDDGGEVWRFQVPDSSVESSPLIIDDRLYVSTMDGQVLAIDRIDGELQWVQNLDSRLVSSPVPGGNGNLCLGSYDNSLYSISLVDGDILWKFETRGYINGSIALVDDRLFFGGCDGQIRSLDSEGVEIFSLDSPSYIPGSPAVRNGAVYSAGYDGTVIAASVQGESLWTRQIGDESFTSSLGVDENRLYIGGKTGCIYALSLIGGQDLWSLHTGGSIESGPVITGTHVFIGSTDNHIYGINKETGDLIFTYDTGAPVSGDVIAVKGRIISANNGGLVTALGNK